MKVNFYATLRPVVGGRSAEIELADEATVQQLLDAVLARYPALRALLLDDAGQLSRHVHLFVNGRGAVYLPDALQTPLATTDVIDIFPAVAGGAV